MAQYCWNVVTAGLVIFSRNNPVIGLQVSLSNTQRNVHIRLPGIKSQTLNFRLEPGEYTSFRVCSDQNSSESSRGSGGESTS